MRKFCALILLTAGLFVSCDLLGPKEEPVVTIDGNWTLSTVQGGPVAYMNISGTLTVTGGSSFSRSTTFPSTGTGTETGTVALKSGSIYTFSVTGGKTGPTDYTLSSDGKTLSNTDDPFMGPHTYTK